MKIKSASCDFCDSMAFPITVNYEFKHKGKNFVLENVEILRCTSCGERYLPSTVVEQKIKIIDSVNQSLESYE
jgi:YgiT-type zinc finger domain-containing protein